MLESSFWLLCFLLLNGLILTRLWVYGRTFRLRLGRQVLVKRSGWLWKTTDYLPYQAICEVKLQQGLWLRWAGLAEMTLETRHLALAPWRLRYLPRWVAEAVQKRISEAAEDAPADGLERRFTPSCRSQFLQ